MLNIYFKIRFSKFLSFIKKVVEIVLFKKKYFIGKILNFIQKTFNLTKEIIFEIFTNSSRSITIFQKAKFQDLHKIYLNKLHKW